MTLSLQFDLTQEKNLLQIDFPWHFIFGNSYFLPSPLSCLSPTFFKKSESKSHQSVTIVTSTIEYSLQVSKLDYFPLWHQGFTLCHWQDMTVQCTNSGIDSKEKCKNVMSTNNIFGICILQNAKKKISLDCNNANNKNQIL